MVARNSKTIYFIIIIILIQIKSIILNDNISKKNKQRNASSSDTQHKYIIKFFIELTESIISDNSKIKPFLKYKDEFSKIKQKKLWNAIKFANKISLGEMTFDQHYAFIKEGIRSYDEQTKKLEEIKREKEKEKEKEKIKEKENEYKTYKDNESNKEDDNYDIIIDDFQNYDSLNSIVKDNKDNKDNKDEENLGNRECMVHIDNKDINDSDSKEDKDKDTNKNSENKNIIENKNINIDNNENKEKKNNVIKNIRINIGNKKKSLGRKRKNFSNSVKHHLIVDLIYSVDDFIYNKRNFKINGYESFFQDIQLKISQTKLNTNGLNVSIYIY